MDHDLAYLLEVAEVPSGGGQRVAQALLSLWDGVHFRADLQSLLYLPERPYVALLRLQHYLHRHGLQLDQLLSASQMQPILQTWEQVLRADRRSS